MKNTILRAFALAFIFGQTYRVVAEIGQAPITDKDFSMEEEIRSAPIPAPLFDVKKETITELEPVDLKVPLKEETTVSQTISFPAKQAETPATPSTPVEDEDLGLDILFAEEEPKIVEPDTSKAPIPAPLTPMSPVLTKWATPEETAAMNKKPEPMSIEGTNWAPGEKQKYLDFLEMNKITPEQNPGSMTK